MQKVFAFLKGLVLAFRSLYIVIMILPLWGCSIYYRVSAEYYPHAHWALVDDNRALISALTFLLGSLALWLFIDMLHERERLGERISNWDKSNMWFLAISLFLTGLGGIFASNGASWGAALSQGGTLAMPVFVLWSFGIANYEPKKAKQEETPPAQTIQQ